MTQLEIINLSLRHLGMVSITQTQLTNSSTPTAIAANAFWEPCRDEVLGESDWSFANTTEAMSSLAMTDSEWAYVYSYPTMAVSTIWNVFNEDSYLYKGDQEFEVKYVASQSNKCVFTDLDDAYAEYTYKVTDPEIWSNKFVMAFSYRLAAAMVMYLGLSADKIVELTQVYNTLVTDAKRLGNSEKRKVPLNKNKYQDAR